MMPGAREAKRTRLGLQQAVLSRMVIEDTVVPRFPSESPALLAMHRQLEERAWKLTDEFLTPAQTEDFRNSRSSA
jgi:hypothetical protein